MGRGRKKNVGIKVNDIESMETLCQEVYFDACSQINDAQRTINEMVNGAKPADVEDLTKIAKTKADTLKIKDSAIKIKLEIAKLQNDIIKHNGDVKTALSEETSAGATHTDFNTVREMIKNKMV